MILEKIIILCHVTLGICQKEQERSRHVLIDCMYKYKICNKDELTEKNPTQCSFLQKYT